MRKYNYTKIERGIKYRIFVNGYGTKEWTLNGILHRVHGPAVITTDTYVRFKWYYQGQPVNVNTQEEYHLWLKYRVFA